MIRFLTVVLLIVVAHSPITFAGDNSSENKKISEELGVWVADNDSFIITFFSDNTFLKLSQYQVVYGKWKQHAEKSNIVSLLFPESDEPVYVTIQNDKFIWHHLDYDDSGFCRLLQGRGANLKINVIDLDKTRKKTPVIYGTNSKSKPKNSTPQDD